MIDIRPKFRPIRPQPATANGQRVLLLQDPLHLAEQVAFIPWTLAPMLALCDGSRDLNELKALSRASGPAGDRGMSKRLLAGWPRMF